MYFQPSLLWTWNRTVDRLPYLLIGCFLFLVKFAIDWTIATRIFGLSWTPLNYVVWPNDRVLRVFELDHPERWFSLTMLVASLPFIWCGVLLTLHRLRAGGLPLILIVLFFVPLVNLLFFTALSLLPTQSLSANLPSSPLQEREVESEEAEFTGALLPPHPNPSPPLRRRGAIRTNPQPVPWAVAASRQLPRSLEPWQRVHRNFVRDSYWRSGLVSLLISVPLLVSAVGISGQVLQSYGFGLFVGAPFALGMISVLLFGFSRPKPLGASLAVAMIAATLVGLAVLAVALEGIICLIMAAPIAYFLVFMGALVGYVIQSRPWLNEHALTLSLGLMLVLPALMAAESVNKSEPVARAIDSELIIDASADMVWRHVLSFPPLAEPDAWFFRTGIAYPQRAEIQGTGTGAVRQCIFSTGTFVEPIDVWEPSARLRFRVTEQPEPMREWSPYSIHPPHLDHYLVCREGQFLLESLPNGRTRLVGTTWYSNRMWPASYWSIWSDYIIHRIHLRVLKHIQQLAEAPKEKD